MLEILKKNTASLEQTAPDATAENNAASNAGITGQPSDNLLQKLLTGITKHGGSLPCSDVEKLMSQCD